jgi:hypothetical protein
MCFRRRSCERCGRGNSRSGPQENLFHAYTYAAPQKENGRDYEKEITDADTVTHSVGRGFPEKEKTFAVAGRNTIAKSEEEKGFTDSKCDANFFTASQEERVAHSAAV